MNATTSAYDRIVARLAERLPDDRIVTDPLRLLAWGTDASLYRLIPKIVVVVENEAEVRLVLSLCRKERVPLTFRAAGTSLSGQAISDSVLCVLGDAWNWLRIEGNAGERIRLRPGVIGAEANRHLLPFAKKIGPDPASIDSCKIGGIVNNNSSGMCCGVAQNTYHTMASLRFMLADGTVLDTADPESRNAFKKSHGRLLAELDGLGRETRADEALSARIRHKFRIKCTTGYSLNALVDHADPIDILSHLIVGSEGTLAFVSEVVLNTVDEHPHKASGMLFFEDVVDAAEAVMALSDQPVASVELFDRLSLKSVEDKPGLPDFVTTLGPSVASLLVETRSESPEGLKANIATLMGVLATKCRLLHPGEFSADPVQAGRLWAIRKGLITAAGAARPLGTTVILEDVCFPMERLAPAVNDLRALLDRSGYPDAVIFGHALAGNLHFLLAQRFDSPEETERFRKFMDGLADLVVGGYDGSLKAEHGTGRNVAPYVEQEWGEQATALMWRIKAIIEPEGMLNPGVLLSDDPLTHVKNTKVMPPSFDAVDKCIECGFCERMCPSKGMTLSPRQRIVAWRDITRREGLGEDVSALKEDYDWLGVDTCAGCGLCATVCPVGIDTGLLTRDLRGKRLGKLALGLADYAAKNFAQTSALTRAGLGAARVARKALGPQRVEGLARGMRKALGSWLPVSLTTLPNPAPGGPQRPPVTARDRVVYLTACTSRVMAPADGAPDARPLPDAVASILAKAGYEAVVPARIDQLCCGLPFDSKGLTDHATQKANEMADAALAASENGRLPILMDASPCTARIKEALKGRVEVFDLPEFLHDHVLPKLDIDQGEEPVLLHLPCSVKRMGGEGKLTALAEACSSNVTIPHGVNCCGFAGDKGLFTPELNAYALRHLCDEAAASGIGISSSRSCEIGLARYGDRPFQSIAYLLDARAKAKVE